MHKIEELLQLKDEIRNTMEQIVGQCVSSDDQKVRVLKSQADPKDFVCYKEAVETFSKTCYNLGQVNSLLFNYHLFILLTKSYNNLP